MARLTRRNGAGGAALLGRDYTAYETGTVGRVVPVTGAVNSDTRVTGPSTIRAVRKVSS
jgi:hypothetical protein